jgi:hypothetical protein
MSCVLAVSVGMSQMVHVVSMLLVMISFGDSAFQSSDVRGAVCSGVLELESSASGVSLRGGASRVLTEEERGMVFEAVDDVLPGSDHRRRWSPEVARRSVACLDEMGGSQRMRVTG